MRLSRCNTAPSVTWARTHPPSPTPSAVSAPLSSFELASVETGMEEAGKNPALGTRPRVTLTGSKVRETAEESVSPAPVDLPLSGWALVCIEGVRGD